MDLNLIITIIGIIGFFFVAGSILLEGFGKIKDRHTFLLYNGIGSFLLVINAYYFEIWIFFALNLILGLADIYGYFKLK